MNKKILVSSIAYTLLTLPIVAFAVPLIPTPGIVGNFNTSYIADIVFALVWPFFAAFAVIMFIYAGILYLRSKVDEANKAVLWGMVGVAIGILAFSIPFIIKTALGL